MTSILISPLQSLLNNTSKSLSYDYESHENLSRSQILLKQQALDKFLSGVEKRAFRMAQIATNQSDDAMDIVQDAMFKLVEKYSQKPEAEWGPLFYRILQSRIHDWYRRTTIRNRFRVWFSDNSANTTENETDFVQTLADESVQNPEHLLETDLDIKTLEIALQALPLRQQQAFLLRAWEGLSVKETAFAMKCSEGSVKTHYSRAKHTLREKIAE